MDPPTAYRLPLQPLSRRPNNEPCSNNHNFTGRGTQSDPLTEIIDSSDDDEDGSGDVASVMSTEETGDNMRSASSSSDIMIAQPKRIPATRCTRELLPQSSMPLPLQSLLLSREEWLLDNSRELLLTSPGFRPLENFLYDDDDLLFYGLTQ